MDKTGKNGGKRPETALIYFTQFGKSPGGSEYLPLSLAAQLQKRGIRVTLALNWKSDVAAAAEILGIPVDVSALETVCVKPTGKLMRKIDAVFPVFSTRRLKRLAKSADIRISTLNLVDFGRPAHHFIYLLTGFGELHKRLVDPGRRAARPSIAHRLFSFFAAAFIRPLARVRSSAKILADRRETVYPNSRFAEKAMWTYFGAFNSRMFYPPTIFEPCAEKTQRDPLCVAYIGQIFPSKRVREVIRIVDAARRLGGIDFKLRIAGTLGNNRYAESIKRMAASRPWVTLEGGVYGSGKAAFLASATYAVHTRRDEEFGISVTEYLKAGLIPVVPDCGGSQEIAGASELEYRTGTQAAEILVSLAKDADLRESVLRHCTRRAKEFTREAYLGRESELVDRIVREAGEGK